MGRLKSGLTLLELLVATILLTTVLMTASTLLVSFKKFYFDFVERQTQVGEISLGVLEDIASKIIVSNKLTISGTGNSRIDISVDEAETPSTPGDDITYGYWLEGGEIKYQKNGAPAGGATLIKNIMALSFELQPVGAPAYNRVKITIGLTSATGIQETFETTVTARSRCAYSMT